MMVILIIFCFIFVCYGTSNQIIYSPGPFGIWDSIRYIAYKIHPSIGYLFTCMRCLPTWVGMILSLIDVFFVEYTYITPSNILFDGNNWIIAVIMDGLIASGVSYLLFTIDNWFMSNSPDVNEETPIELDLNQLLSSVEFKNEIHNIIDNKNNEENKILND